MQQPFVQIPLTHGKTAIVDSSDAALVLPFRWSAIKTKAGWYAIQARATGRERTETPVYMHRLIIGAGPGDPEVDHGDGDGLNNRRSNLRSATHSQNMGNMVKPQRKRGNTSRFKGVNWCAERRRWCAGIMVNYRRTGLGRFTVEEDAARAYDEAALRHFGEYARLNFLKH